MTLIRPLAIFLCRLSASCVHVSGLLHALVAMNPDTTPSEAIGELEEDEESIPVTSRLCRWRQPRKQKEKALKMSETVYTKHEYGKVRKQKVVPLADFDPRPPELRGKATEHLPALLNRVRGKGLCISLLFDPVVSVSEPLTHQPLSLDDLKKKIGELKLELSISEEMARKIESETKLQRKSQKWFEMRCFRLTASFFGRAKSLKSTTAPDGLVLQILGVKKIPHTTAMQWGIDHEDAALQQYTDYQHRHGHGSLYVCNTGLYISVLHPFLGASPDGAVYDVNASGSPYGFAEVKCPYSKRHLTPVEASESPGFCCTIQDGQPKLRRTHPYYSQVQGQLAIGCREWCDFIIYTEKGISCERRFRLLGTGTSPKPYHLLGMLLSTRDSTASSPFGSTIT